MISKNDNKKNFMGDVNDVVRSVPSSLKGTTRQRILALAVLVVFFILFTYGLFKLYPYIKVLEQYGYAGVFLASLATSSTVVVPFPITTAATAVAVTVAHNSNPVIVALLYSIGSVLGEVIAYTIGFGGGAVIARRRSVVYQKSEKFMRRYGGLAIFFFALVPLFVFDIVGIIAGALRFPIYKFILFCWAGRLPRAFIEIYAALGLFQIIFPSFFK